MRMRTEMERELMDRLGRIEQLLKQLLKAQQPRNQRTRSGFDEYKIVSGVFTKNEPK